MTISSGAPTADRCRACVPRDRVPPGNIFDRNTERRGQSLTLDRAGRVVAADDNFHELAIQSRGDRELCDTDAGCIHVALNRLHFGRYVITNERLGAGRPPPFWGLLFWRVRIFLCENDQGGRGRDN